jgi:hypothetical protein
MLVDLSDLIDESTPEGMLHVEDAIKWPVEVVGNVRDLLKQLISRVRHDSPLASPDKSTVNSWWQDGQVTTAEVCPSWLMRR